MDEFKHFWPLTDEEKAEVWKDGTIIPDTNVLLAPYRMNEESRENLLAILEHQQIRDRLWFPNRVMEEYARNRMNTISEQDSSSKRIFAALEKALNEIRHDHPFVDRKKVDLFISELKESHDEARNAYPFTYEDDPVLKRITDLSSDRTGAAPDSQELENVRKQAKYRNESKIPPGYMDRNKSGDGAMGDYLIWNQVCKEMGSRKSHAIFILDDLKEDWWEIVGGKRLGPRSELRKEYREATGKEIVFVTSPKFAEWAKQRTHMELSDTFNEQLRKATWNSLASDLAVIPKAVSDFQIDLASALGRTMASLHEELLRSWSMRLPTESLPAALEMAEWFLDNYEDPAIKTPYESKEGGYQFIYGGPYDCEAEIREQFFAAPEAAIAKAVEIVKERSGGVEQWTKKHF